MAAIGHSELTGIENVEGMLEILTGDEIVKIAERSLKRTMIKMRDDAVANCPVAKEDGGELQKSIHVKTGLSPGGHLRGDLIASTEYAVFVEMGTGPEGEKGLSGKNVSPLIRSQVTYSTEGWVFPTGETNPKTGKPEYRYTEGMPPRPYLYPAFQRYRKKVKKNIMRSLARNIKARKKMT